MVMAWYILSSAECAAGAKGMESAGSEGDAELGEGCIVGLPLSAFRLCYEIEGRPVPVAP